MMSSVMEGVDVGPLLATDLLFLVLVALAMYLLFR